jgi:hypothetical protein
MNRQEQKQQLVLQLGYAKINMVQVESYEGMLDALYHTIDAETMPEAALDDDMLDLLRYMIKEWKMLTLESQPGWLKQDKQLMSVDNAHHLQHTDIAGIIPTSRLSALRDVLSHHANIHISSVAISQTKLFISAFLQSEAYASSWRHVTRRYGNGNTGCMLEPQRTMPMSLQCDVNNTLFQLRDMKKTQLCSFLYHECVYVNIVDRQLGRPPAFLAGCLKT